MNAKDLIRAGRLTEARAQLTSDVKAAPSDSGKRTLLFQVLAFLGEWDKAERHLDMIVTLDPKSETGAQVYKNLIAAEKERREVIERKRIPGFPSGAPAYLDLYLTALDRLKEKKAEEASRLLTKIEQQRPLASGSIDGKRFSGFSDIDAFLSCFLEAVVHDRYMWIPFESIGELSVTPPKSLTDLLWVPAQLSTWEGLSMHCYLPVVYPDSQTSEDDRVKLGRMTDWIPLGGSFFKGIGQHMFQVGEEEIPLLELREVTFTLAERKE